MPSAAALLLLAGHGQLDSQLQLRSGNITEASDHEQPRSAAEAHLQAQHAWRQRQRQQLSVLAAPSLLGAAPEQAVEQAPASQQQQQEEVVPAAALQQQRSSGADRPLEFDGQTASALAACMVVSCCCSLCVTVGLDMLESVSLHKHTGPQCCLVACLCTAACTTHPLATAMHHPPAHCILLCRTLARLPPAAQVAALANSAGIGGGAFIVPLMYLGLGFDIKDSTALSQAVIVVSWAKPENMCLAMYENARSISSNLQSQHARSAMPARRMGLLMSTASWLSAMHCAGWRPWVCRMCCAPAPPCRPSAPTH